MRSQPGRVRSWRTHLAEGETEARRGEGTGPRAGTQPERVSLRLDAGPGPSPARARRLRTLEVTEPFTWLPSLGLGPLGGSFSTGSGRGSPPHGVWALSSCLGGRAGPPLSASLAMALSALSLSLSVRDSWASPSFYVSPSSSVSMSLSLSFFFLLLKNVLIDF